MIERANFPPEVGSCVVVRHNDPIFDEPHQVEGEVVSVVKTEHSFLWSISHKLFGLNPQIFNIAVKTLSPLGIVMIKGVTTENVYSVIDPGTL